MVLHVLCMAQDQLTWAPPYSSARPASAFNTAACCAACCAAPAAAALALSVALNLSDMGPGLAATRAGSTSMPPVLTHTGLLLLLLLLVPCCCCCCWFTRLNRSCSRACKLLASGAGGACRDNRKVVAEHDPVMGAVDWTHPAEGLHASQQHDRVDKVQAPPDRSCTKNTIS